MSGLPHRPGSSFQIVLGCARRFSGRQNGRRLNSPPPEKRSRARPRRQLMNKAIIATAYMFSPIALGPALAVSITYKCNNGSTIQADTVKQSIIVTDKDGTSFVQPNVRINDPPRSPRKSRRRAPTRLRRSSRLRAFQQRSSSAWRQSLRMSTAIFLAASRRSTSASIACIGAS